MSFERVCTHFKQFGLEGNYLSIPSGEQPDKALGCLSGRVIQTLPFAAEDGSVILIVASGKARLDAAKFRARFGFRPHGILSEQAEEKIGHRLLGLCPFGVNDEVEVYLDLSVQRFSSIFCPCGSENKYIELSVDDLELYSGATGWVNLCKGWQP